MAQKERSPQFLDPFPNTPSSPERNLCAAVLARAIMDYASPIMIERQIRREARVWLFEQTRPTIRWSLEWVCAQLGLNASELRGALLDRSRLPYICEKLK